MLFLFSIAAYGLKKNLDNGPLPVEEFAIVVTSMAAKLIKLTLNASRLCI